MSVGVLLITHSGIGGALIKAAQDTFGKLPLNITQLSVSKKPYPEFLIAKASYLVELLNDGDGVLILTDMFGSTPSNIAHTLQHRGFQVHVITGVNVPMLFRVMNYPHLPLEKLAQKALTGGKEGILEAMTKIDVAIRQELREDKVMEKNVEHATLPLSSG